MHASSMGLLCSADGAPDGAGAGGGGADRDGVAVQHMVATAMTADKKGRLIDSVGVKLTATDVTRVIGKAVANRGGKVHWPVDTASGTLLRGVLGLLPARGQRALMKSVSGY
jgi:hypothetical protein